MLRRIRAWFGRPADVGAKERTLTASEPGPVEQVVEAAPATTLAPFTTEEREALTRRIADAKVQEARRMREIAARRK